jgi:hypothetical protein
LTVPGRSFTFSNKQVAEPRYHPANGEHDPREEHFMPVETPSIFAQVIKEHLDLKEKNSRLDDTMPIARYKDEDPFVNHPLFKSEEQARIEETMDGVEPDFSDASLENVGVWPGEPAEELTAETREAAAPAPVGEDSAFWGNGGARDFDWGD